MHTIIDIDVDALTAGDVIDRHTLEPLTVASVEWRDDFDPCVAIDGCRKHGMWLVRWTSGGWSVYADGSTERVIVPIDDDYDDDLLRPYRPMTVVP